MGLQKAFDQYADQYDAVFTQSLIGKAQRKQVYHILSAYIQPKNALNILEINCGTGTDALYMAELGHQVTATDISAAMIEQARLKDPSSKVQYKQAAFEDLEQHFSAKSFDLILSNFGGLNCIDPMETRQLSRFLL